MKTDAKFSNCLNYRFALWRTWDESKPFAMFIGLNPSKADEVEHNPTINRCINLAKSWGYGGACMANLFAYRATDPSEMKLQIDPVGAENDEWLVKLASGAGVVVAVWGSAGNHLNRSKVVKDMLSNLHYLKINKSGEPAHILYLKTDLKPVPIGS